MRIALFVRCLPAHGLGGMEIHAEQVARGLVARGHEVVIYTTRLAEGPREERDGPLTILYLPGTRPRTYLGGYWRSSRDAFLRDHARRPYDAVFSESTGALGILGAPRPAAPVVVFLVGTPGADLVSKIRQLPRPRAALGIGWNLIVLVRARRRLRRASRVLCESEGLRAWAIRELALDPERVEAAWLGVDTQGFTPDGPILPEIERALSGLDRVIFGGRFEPEKGFDVALRALAPLVRDRPRAGAVLIGAGREGDRLAALARPIAETGRFLLLPPIPHARLPELYRAASIYLMPTRRHEGSALSIVEAMACGRAVVASRIGGIPSLVRDGEDALLVPPEDDEALRSAIARLLDDPHLRGRLGARARESAVARLSLDGMLGRIESALARAAAEQGRCG